MQAGNDFRLGAQEAPPAIISLYPGQVTDGTGNPRPEPQSI